MYLNKIAMREKCADLEVLRLEGGQLQIQLAHHKSWHWGGGWLGGILERDGGMLEDIADPNFTGGGVWVGQEHSGLHVSGRRQRGVDGSCIQFADWCWHRLSRLSLHGK